MIVAIGSFALKQHGLRDRIDDLDLVGTRPEFDEWVAKVSYPVISMRPMREWKYRVILRGDTGEPTRVEFELARPGTSSEGLVRGEWGAHHRRFSTGLGQFCVPDMRALMTIKRAHLHVPLIGWQKHMDDYQAMRAHLARTSDASWYHELYRLRRTETDAVHPPTKARLDMSNEAFFAKSESKVRRSYDHDELHAAAAPGREPMYRRIKRDQSRARCDRDLFDALSLEDQVRCVQEEAAVIAFERNVSYGEAVRRICTTLTSGWFREFAIDHYPAIMADGGTYLSNICSAYAAGRLRRQMEVAQ